MNNIEKAQLVKELRELSLSLEHQALTLFETAKSKKRIQDICYLFQDSSFEKFLPNNLTEHEIKVTAAGPMQIPEAIQKTIQRKNTQPQNSSQQIDDLFPSVNHASNTDHIHVLVPSEKMQRPTENTTLLEDQNNITQKAQLTSVQLGQFDFDIQEIAALTEFSLYQISNFNAASCLIVFHEKDAEKLTSRTIYMAEQYDEIGCFKQYLVYFGSTDIEEALEYIQKFKTIHQLKISTVRKTIWSSFEQAMKNNEQLFHCFSQAQNIECQFDSVISFMPRSLIYSQKFILFEEADCSFETPIVFLEEREKNRLICGERRLLLNEKEAFIPFIRYQRQQGLSWKIIQETISDLPHPIMSSDLIHALNLIVKRT